MYYRHKPLPVKAWHFREECKKEDIPQWLRDRDMVNYSTSLFNLRVTRIVFGYGDGALHISPGYWIVMDEDDEVFACCHAAFIAQYEKADIADGEAANVSEASAQAQ